MANLFHVLLLIATFSLFSFASTTVKNPLLAMNHSTVFMQDERDQLMLALDTAKLDPHLLSPYTFSLYHRDMLEKSSFADYDSLLEARIARDVSRSRYLASLFGSSKINSELEEPADEPHTSVYFFGLYVASFWLGSELERSLLLLDIGSPLVWWQCGPCEPSKCYQQDFNPVYNSTASTSFQEIDCTVETSSCLLPLNVTTCSQQSHRCEYQIGYGSGQMSNGYMAHETLTFILTQTSARIEFGCGKDQTSGEQFQAQFGGIAGLGGALYPEGLGRYSLPTQLNASLFSFCLPSPSSQQPSTLNFHTSPWANRGDGLKASLLRDDTYHSFYYVQLSIITVAGGTYSVGVETDNYDGRVFVDSGSLFTYLPREVYGRLKSAVKDSLQYEIPVEYPDGQFELCYETDQVKISDFPSVELYFMPDNSRSLYLAKEQVVTEHRGRYCLAFIPAAGPYAYIGNYQLYGTALTFDLSAMNLTFNQKACL